MALVDNLRTFDSMLSADAKVFVSAQLRRLFDTKTGQWQHAPDPFSRLLAGWVMLDISSPGVSHSSRED